MSAFVMAYSFEIGISLMGHGIEDLIFMDLTYFTTTIFTAFVFPYTLTTMVIFYLQSSYLSGSEKFSFEMPISFDDFWNGSRHVQGY